MEYNRCIVGDCVEVLPTLEAGSVQCCVTSPPYWGLRDYGVAGQFGLESTPEEYVAKMVQVFREVKRVLRDDGTLWLNLGDSYAGSGRGGNPDAGTKQGTNAGSQTIGVLYGREKDSAAAERARIKEQFKALSNSGIKPKDLVGIPWRVAFALQADGWYLRQDIIWHKPNPMPESVRDRCTKAHEYIFVLTKSAKYYFDAEAIAEPVAASTVVRAKSDNNADKRKDGGAAVNQCGLTLEQQNKYYADISAKSVRNKRSVWTVATKPFKGAHFATFPPDLIEPCILAGSKPGDVVLDPFFGSGTTGQVAQALGRRWLGIELNPEYLKLAELRTAQNW